MTKHRPSQQNSNRELLEQIARSVEATRRLTVYNFALNLSADRKLDRLLAEQRKHMATSQDALRETRETRAGVQQLIAHLVDIKRQLQELIDAGGSVDTADLQTIVTESDETQAEILSHLPTAPPVEPTPEQ